MAYLHQRKRPATHEEAGLLLFAGVVPIFTEKGITV
ncbi:hypothetical protein Ptc2401_00769 [Prosthecochloris sp. CIB 2401]|nr:hypothetical protein Ptc2401_00769 [Prosthecochloris sp. CIB 2401]